jgi:hypothetical protein
VLGTLRLEGAQIADRRALDVRGSVLRTVSYGWSGYPETLDSTGRRALHHIETFDLSAGHALARIDHCSFDAGQYGETSLFNEAGVLVVGATAHAYAIDAQGHCRDVGSPPLQAGSSSTLRAFAGGSRVLEVVENTESAPAGANRPAKAQLTLYDATDLARLSPISRVNFDMQRDDGYRPPDSVEIVEGGSAAHAADGTTESGMILLAGWGYGGQYGVVLATFSDHTLTARGSLDFEYASGERIMPLKDGVAVALDSQTLRGVRLDMPDAPILLSQVETHPAQYFDLFDFGEQLVRVAPLDPQWTKLRLDVVERASLGRAEPLWSLTLPEGSNFITRSAQWLVDFSYADGVDDEHASVRLYDFSNPARPVTRGQLADVPEFRDGLFTFGPVIAGAERVLQEDQLGVGTFCSTHPPASACALGTDCDSPTYYWGTRNCVTRGTGEETCDGALLLCERATDSCSVLADPPPGSTKQCSNFDDVRQWFSYTVHLLDLRDPDHPQPLPAIELPRTGVAASLIAEGQVLYASWFAAVMDAGVSTGRVHDYVTRIDLSDPVHPSVSDPIQVPGPVVAVVADALYTAAPDSSGSGLMLSRLELADGKALLQAWNVLPGATLSRAVRDASGHLVIVTDPSQRRNRSRDASEGVVLQVLDAQDLHVLGATLVDSAASWIGSARDRAAFAVPGGTSIIDYSEATQPKLHAYLPGGAGVALFDGEYLDTPERRIDVRASQHVTSP